MISTYNFVFVDFSTHSFVFVSEADKHLCNSNLKLFVDDGGIEDDDDNADDEDYYYDKLWRMTIIFMTIITMMGIAPLPWSAQHQGQEPTHYEAMPEKVNIETIFPALKTYAT